MLPRPGYQCPKGNYQGSNFSLMLRDSMKPASI